MGYRLLSVRETADIEPALKKINKEYTYEHDDEKEEIMNEQQYIIEYLQTQDICVFHYEEEDIVILVPVDEATSQRASKKTSAKRPGNGKKKWIPDSDDVQNTRALYFSYIHKLKNAEFRAHFEEIAGGALKELLPLTIPVIPLRSDEEYLPQRRANVVYESYLLRNTHAGHTITLDPGILHTLCQAKLDLKYMQETLTPGSMRAVLLVVAYEQKETREPTLRTPRNSPHSSSEKQMFGEKVMKGIRVTKLDTRVGKLHIEGKYACSSGYGELIELYSEELLRNELAHLVNRRHGTQEQVAETSPGTARPTKKTKANNPPEFTLYAIPQAVGFWRDKVHFKELHSRNLHKMSKRIYPEDQADTTLRRT